jgi:fatty acid desaturase
MCLNLLVDAVVGSIPVVGDVFDVVWRANDRNVRLLEARLADPSGERRDRVAVAALGAAVFLAVLAVGLAGVAAVWWVLGAAGVV